MADVNATVQNAAAGIVGVIKALIVLFVFVNIIYSTGFDPIGGIVDLVNTFLDGGFAGLLASGGAPSCGDVPIASFAQPPRPHPLGQPHHICAL